MVEIHGQTMAHAKHGEPSKEKKVNLMSGWNGSTNSACNNAQAWPETGAILSGSATTEYRVTKKSYNLSEK
jgi:hypothetical protein